MARPLWEHIAVIFAQCGLYLGVTFTNRGGKFLQLGERRCRISVGMCVQTFLYITTLTIHDSLCSDIVNPSWHPCKHKASMETPSPQNSTTLSTHFLKEKEAGKNPTLSWKFLKTNIPTFNPVTEICIKHRHGPHPDVIVKYQKRVIALSQGHVIQKG